MLPTLLAECRLLISLATPICLTYLVNFAMLLTSQSIVGHISADALAAASLATVFCNATGLAVLIGLTSGCETLCSQAFGAGNLPRVGVIMQRGCAVALAVCVPVSAAWLSAGPMLRALGQDEATVALAESYAALQVLGLPAVACYEVLKRGLQCVSVATPQVAIAGAALVVNAALGAGLVYGTPLGLLGAPIALAVTQWLMLGLAIAYIRTHRRVHTFVRAAACKRGSGGSGGSAAGDGDALAGSKAAVVEVAALNAMPTSPPRPPPGLAAPQLSGASATAASAALVELPPPLPLDLDDMLDSVFSVPPSFRAATSGWGEYLCLGIPSALLLVTEWGSFEVGALFAGLISTPVLASHTVIASTAALSFMPPLGLSVATGIRIGQLCGDVDVPRAKVAYAASFALDCAFVLVNAAIILGGGRTWPLFFTDDPAVVQLVGSSIWILAVYSCFDSFQCIGAGGLRGLGLPGMGAAANVVGWVLVGLPLAWLFSMGSGDRAGQGLPGIWWAFTFAVTTTFVLMSLVLFAFADWQKIAVASRARGLKDAATEAATADAAAAAAIAAAAVAAAAAPAVASVSTSGASGASA